VDVNGVAINLLVKNVTYLGHPHSLFKKRIQVPFNWRLDLNQRNSFLVGVYVYKDNTLFIFFDKKKRGKNSSAHVHSVDLLKVTESGIFRKVDKKDNTVVVCQKNFFLPILEKMIANEEIESSEEPSLFEEFFISLNPCGEWLSAYREMIAADFRNKFQGEWPWWYPEFTFEDFLKRHTEYAHVCQYVQKKKIGDLDFDLMFIKNNFVGDLKTRADSSIAILGNNKKSVMEAISVYKKIWYVTFVFLYRMDKDFGCEVSRFWNSEQNRIFGSERKEKTSYCGKMKHDGVLLSVYILEINKFNMKYLSDFN